MSEAIPVHLRSRGEYDLFVPDRVRTQKLARHVIYTLMLEIEGDQKQSGRVTAEITRVPVLFDDGAALPIEVGFMNDDAQHVFRMSGIMKNDELYLQPDHLQLVRDGRRLEHGYFLASEDEVDMAIVISEMLDNTVSISLT